MLPDQWVQWKVSPRKKDLTAHRIPLFEARSLQHSTIFAASASILNNLGMLWSTTETLLAGIT